MPAPCPRDRCEQRLSIQLWVHAGSPVTCSGDRYRNLAVVDQGVIEIEEHGALDAIHAANSAARSTSQMRRFVDLISPALGDSSIGQCCCVETTRLVAV